MMEDPKKVEADKRVAEYNYRKREEMAKAQNIKSEHKLTSSQYYGAGTIVAIGALGILGYHVYQFKKGDITKVTLVQSSETH